MISKLAEIAGIAGLCLTLYLIGRLRRSTEHQLNAQLASIRSWAIGPRGLGWTEADIDGLTFMKWHHPRFAVIPVGAASGLLSLTALDNFFLSEDLRRRIVALAVAVDALNSYISIVAGFVAGDPVMSVTVSRKLDKVVGPAGPKVPVRNTQELFTAAALTEDEMAWSTYLATMVRTAHTQFIGDSSGKGIHRHLRELEQQMRRDGVAVRMVAPDGSLINS